MTLGLTINSVLTFWKFLEKYAWSEKNFKKIFAGLERILRIFAGQEKFCLARKKNLKKILATKKKMGEIFWPEILKKIFFHQNKNST